MSAVRAGSRWGRAAWVLAVMAAGYVVVFGTLTWRQQSRFGTFGFDMGIYDQSIWLLSQFKTPFCTVRGLNYFGHHVNPITLLFVPAYWLGAGPHFLYLVETLWLAAGAVPLWLLGRDLLDDEWLALAPPAAYLLYPALEWINWWHFHPDALAITPLFFAWWFARRGRWTAFAVAIVVALLCKEDVGLAVLVLGLVVAVKVERRWGLVTAAAGAAWFALCTRVVIPHANGIGPFYQDFFPGFGHGVVEIAGNVVTHPGRVLRLATRHDSLTYYRQLLLPVALVPIVALPLLAVGAPQVLVNVVSGFPYTRQIRYHYSSLPLAAVFLATVEGMALLTDRVARLSLKGVVAGVLVAAAIAGNVAWSPSPLGRDFHSGVWAAPSPAHTIMEQAVHLVRPGDAVTATYYLVPHLTHRVLIYEWPNPWVVANWGVRGENPGDPAKVDVLVLDRRLLGDQSDVFRQLTAPDGEFEVVLDKDNIVVARRVRPPSTGTAG